MASAADRLPDLGQMAVFRENLARARALAWVGREDDAECGAVGLGEASAP